MKKEWLSLKEAASQLAVHPTTLRRWADQGDIPVMLTPGGHRRFSASDVAHMATARPAISKQSSLEQVWADTALTETRREIARPTNNMLIPEMDESMRSKHRTLGRRLMAVTLQYISSEPENVDLLQEARLLGEMYGRIGTELGSSLTASLQAAMFFRDKFVETALELPETTHIQPEANLRLLKRVNKILNEVQLAIAEVYESSESNFLPGQ